MTNKETFKIWAPTNARWVDWVRPVAFISINDSTNLTSLERFPIPTLRYMDSIQKNMAIIVDLPNHQSIEEGLALAKLGYRPIPLYNGTHPQIGAMALVDTHTIGSALVWGATLLKEINIDFDAPPAFLLDSHRMHRYKMDPSIFDNSWDLYDQDIPSASYFLNHHIDSILIVSEKIQKDLIKILYKFQNKGITIYYTNGFDSPKKVIIKKPLRKDK